MLEGDLSRERLGLPGYPAVTARFFLDWAVGELGRFDEAIADGQDGLRLAEALDHPYSQAAMCSALGYLHTTRGELGDGIRLLERGVALSREWNLPIYSVRNTGLLDYAYALAGRVPEGISSLERGLRASETMGFRAVQPFFMAYLGETYILADGVANSPGEL